MPKVDVDGVKLYYEEEGEGFPLVFLHPWPTDHAMWMFQVPVFSEHYRVITPDIRGLGRSDKPESGYELRRLSDDVNGLLDRLGVKKAYVVGLSLGGCVSQRFTVDHSEKVQATIWIGAPKVPADEFMFEEKGGRRRPLPEIYLEALESKGYLHFWESVWKANLSYMFHKDFASSPIGSYLIRYLFEDRYARFNKDPHGTIGLIRALAKETILDELRDVRVPAAIVVSDGDPTLPYCREQHQYCPQAEYLEVDNSGHMSIMDQAEVLNAFIMKFLRRHERVP